ncbi:GTP-binding protein [Eubacterium xylanophilum]|uniref:GTP-binding protein n=1 Tax=Eubacterium xylanophilum TaxID=39497 RepID=UPI00047DEF2C|nr:GTP-binding protein [Eubacterium xylanophilum]
MKKEDMNIVIVGHVDHGKSTLMGRLLADTDSLPQGKLEQVKETCRRNSKPFEYAFLLDALKDEQSQGITIDTARCFFKTEKRDYIILDAPGHIEFLKNMITGAARASAALLMIDAKEGVQENSRRHAYMLSMLGIKQIAVVINKMDLVDYSQEVFEKVKAEYLEFLKQINIQPKFVLPVSAFQGENIVKPSDKMPWYDGMDILQVLDGFECEEEKDKQAFRMPVQDVYKFTKNGDDRRIVAGTIESGTIRPGDEVVFYPSGKKSHIKTIETFNAPPILEGKPGMAIGFTIKEQIYITRGEIMAIKGEMEPKSSSRIAANVFWLGKKPLAPGKNYFLKIGGEKVRMEIEEIKGVINSSNLSSEGDFSVIEKNEVGEVVIKTEKPIAFDLVEENAATSRFVIVDEYEIAGGGIITESLVDDEADIRTSTRLRNYKWETGEVDSETRIDHYAQRPRLILLTGEKNTGKKELAKALEKVLIDKGRYVYYMGIGSYLYGVGADTKKPGKEDHKEQIRRFGEVANLMLDAGMILIVTGTNMTESDRRIIKTVIQGDMDVYWVGDEYTTDIRADHQLPDSEFDYNKNIAYIIEQLRKSNTIFY